MGDAQPRCMHSLAKVHPAGVGHLARSTSLSRLHVPPVLLLQRANNLVHVDAPLLGRGSKQQHTEAEDKSVVHEARHSNADGRVGARGMAAKAQLSR